MMDKMIPYFDVVMVRPEADARGAAYVTPALPEGYRHAMYAEGDMAGWCRIETAVAEFDSEDQARGYFERTFLPYPEELTRRMVFIQDPDGKAIADAAAWWQDDETLGRVHLLHWVAVHPDAQGLGLGRTVVCKALSLFPTLGLETGGRNADIWLTTQTWSHVAIGLYLSLGFRAHRTYRLGGHENGFEGAARTLEGVMRPADYEKFIETAIG
ncbi:GNAT family N-acetyltransferase [Eubacteriales bacterium OttesenSCG-928-A19]|nr:GNAT family N-acetyltransferase [Eubacteriales bacterium OttesenSCG-928-A19]